MSSSNALDRRSFGRGIAAACLAGSCLNPISSAAAQSLGGVARIAPIFAIPIIYWYLNRGTGSANASGSAAPESQAARAAREAAEREAALDEADRPTVEAFAAYTKTEFHYAKPVVRTLGREVVSKAIDGKLAIWPEIAIPKAQYLDVTIVNRSSRPIISRLHIAIDDLATGEPDFNYAYRGYRVDPHSTFRYAAPFDHVFRRPGLKRVSIINQPRHLQTQSVELLVVPGTAVPVTEAANSVRPKKPA